MIVIRERKKIGGKRVIIAEDMQKKTERIYIE